MTAPARRPWAWRALFVLAAAALVAASRGRARAPHDDEPPARWTLDPRPAVEVGTGEGEDALFRVTSAARLADGRIAVANAGTYQVRVFGPGGEHVATLGRRGSGPGEFQVPFWVGARADSLLVWDAALERLTVFDGRGGLARTAQFPSTGGAFPSLVGAFGDGSLLMASGVDHAAAARASGAWRGRTLLLRMSAAGRLLDTLTTLPSDERYSYASGDGMGVVAEDLPLGRRTVMAVSQGHVVFGTGEGYRIRAVDTARSTRVLLAKAYTPRAVSRLDIQEYWRRLVTLGGRADPARAEAERRRVPYPRTLPPYEDLLVASDRAVWIKDAQPPQGWDDPDTWRVYSAAGEPRATIVLPARLRPQAIGDDWILCTALDEHHRETVRLYRYRRG